MAKKASPETLADFARVAIRNLPHKRILTREDMKQVVSEAVKNNQLASIQDSDEDWVKDNKEKTAEILAHLTSDQLDYQWDMLYVVWSDFIKQR